MKVQTLYSQSWLKNSADYWVRIHGDACVSPRDGAESALVTMANGITEYAQFMVASDDNGNGTTFDSVRSPAVGGMLAGFRTLLNGDLGRLDGGLCDAWVCEIARVVGWDLDMDQPSWDPDVDRVFKD